MIALIIAIAFVFYGGTGLVIQFLYPERHPVAPVWFLTALIGGLSVMLAMRRSARRSADSGGPDPVAEP